MAYTKKIAVNTRFLIKNQLEGLGLFTYESLKRITQSHPEIEFYFLFDRAYDEEFIFGSNVKPVVLHPQARHPFLWWWWFEVSVGCWLKANKPHLFLSPDNYACLTTEVPQVVVMHDLSFEHFKDHVPLLALKYYERYLPRFARKAQRIATVSEFSKADIVSHYGVNPTKIDVVYNGAKEVYKPIDENAKAAVKNKYAAGKDYFIYVGSIHPRKNVANLLIAFDKFKTDTPNDCKLVIVGRKAWDFQDVDYAHTNMQHKQDVIFLGHVPPAELGDIVAAAYAMVYVSLFEGFGIPIVEAMSCDVPVITSNITSMPEAAGDAAMLVNPYRVNEISAALTHLYVDKEARQQLIEKGRLQLQKFSWDKTAEKLWACCAKVLG
ncbi:MAG: glycosyltransferase family 1 protein [Chitinophagales bacterium]